VFGVFLIILSIPLVSYLTRPGSCFDGTQNQDEVGIDCGGACVKFCPSQVSDLIILWSRSIKVTDGVYDAVVFIENPNVEAGIRKIAYSFKLYDTDNILIAEREGKTFVNPNDQFAILEGHVETGKRILARTFFEFQEVPQWIRVDNEKPDLLVKNKKIEALKAQPKLKATLVNRSFLDLENVVLTVLLFDEEDNVFAVSKTEVDVLAQNSSQDIVFLFPQALAHTPLRINVIPRVNVVDIN